MSEEKNYVNIVPDMIETGPAPFDIYVKNESFGMALFCHSGYVITLHEKQELKRNKGNYFIEDKDKGTYIEYSSNRLEKIVNNPNIEIKDKAEILHEVGVRCVKNLLDNPRNADNVKESQTITKHYVEMMLDAPETASYLFALSALNSYTYSHSINVAVLNILMAEHLYSRDRTKMWEIALAGLFHDIGKTEIDPKILFKESPLTKAEEEEMKRHPIYGEAIINSHGFSKEIKEAVRHHHERWHGGGYPDGIRGSAIHLFARVTALCNIYDALTSDKANEKAVSPLEAIKMIKSKTGYFDEVLLKDLINVVVGSDFLERLSQAKKFIPK